MNPELGQQSDETLKPSTYQFSLRKVPVLDLSQFTQGDSRNQKEFVESVFTGLQEYGFIILENHGIQISHLNRSYQLLEELFSLPEEKKMEFAKVQGGARGYTPFGKEHAKDSLFMDLKEFWHVGREGLSPANVWPPISGFAKHFQDLFFQLESVAKVILQSLAWPLDVDIHYFERMVENGNSILRLLHYPPLNSSQDPRCLRAAPHEDINLITLLPAATATGLQLKDRDGKWLDVGGDAGQIIVDTGDMMARLTNDVLPATTHQVVNVETGRSRYSMPFFMHPHSEAILSCLPSCRGLGAKYVDITAGEYLNQRLREIGLLK